LGLFSCNPWLVITHFSPLLLLFSMLLVMTDLLSCSFIHCK
jgi:hypothetical protein